MADLYPLLLLPEFHTRVWGTRDLRPYFQRPVEGEPIGEVWLTGEECKVANGPLAGHSLGALSLDFGEALTGSASPLATRFPLLIKFLFPRQKLSVQVHPNDEEARQSGEACGKTECWYVARAVAGAQVGLGLRAGINREMFRMAIEARQAEHMLNWIDVRGGEMLYVDAGTVHAIGPNAIFVETQQNCDLTYRLYDYGRPRELHLESGLAVLREQTSAGSVAPERVGDHDLLVASPHFVVEKYQVNQPVEFSAEPGLTSAQVLLCLDGGAVVESAGGEPVPMMRGECVVIPAAVERFSVRPQWTAEVMRMRLPAKTVAEPRATLHTGSTTHEH